MDAPSMPSAPQPAMPQQGGSGKKWFLFGCGGCLLLIVLMGAVGAGLVMFVFNVIKNTDVYKTALTRAQNSSEVQSALGVPIEGGFLVTGNVDMNNGNGNAEITFPVSGPKGEAEVHAKATSQAGGPWDYSVLQVTVKGTNQVIDLRGPPSP